VHLTSLSPFSKSPVFSLIEISDPLLPNNSLKTASAMGSIMAVVAVLLIHIDKKKVVAMKPNIRLQRSDAEEHLHCSRLTVSSLERMLFSEFMGA